MRHARARRPAGQAPPLAHALDALALSGLSAVLPQWLSPLHLEDLLRIRGPPRAASETKDPVQEAGANGPEGAVLVGFLIFDDVEYRGRDLRAAVCGEEHPGHLDTTGPFSGKELLTDISISDGKSDLQGIKCIYGGVHALVEIPLASLLILLSIDVRRHRGEGMEDKLRPLPASTNSNSTLSAHSATPSSTIGGQPRTESAHVGAVVDSTTGRPVEIDTRTNEPLDPAQRV